MPGSLSKKKPMVIKGNKLPQVFRTACNRTIPAKITSPLLKFTASFMDFDDQSLIMDNRLNHLDDVRQLRNRDLTLYFPFRKTLLRGTVRLVGLTTYKGIRALRFTIPDQLVTDEKRGVKRIRHLPRESLITFHTPDLRIFHGRIFDASPTGVAVILDRTTDEDVALFQEGSRFQAEASLSGELKLSFVVELRYAKRLELQLGDCKLGFRIHKLRAEGQTRYNEWLFKCNIHETEVENNSVKIKAARAEALAQEKPGTSILVIGPENVDLDFWYQCLGRKYEVITCDANIANIRDSLNTNPGLLLIYLDSQNASKASFTRKFCSSLNNRYPIMFFGDEPDSKRQETLVGNVNNKGFLDMSERKLLNKFRFIDEFMSRGNGS